MGASPSKVHCSQRHAHRNAEDARECDNYNSKRLKEEDEIRALNRNVYGDKTTRNCHYTDEIQSEGKTKANNPKHVVDYTVDGERQFQADDITAGYGSPGCCPCSKKKFKCASHHKHKTLKEAEECNRRFEQRCTEEHESRMQDIYDRGQRNGILR